VVVTVPLPNDDRERVLRSATEAALAIVVIVALGVALWLFTGESLGGEPSGTTVPIVVDTAAAARGETIAANTGCLACHTADGATSSGPTWKGLAGSSRPLESGETVMADDAYLGRSITDPLADVVAGFDPVMPTTYSDQLTEAEIDDLVEYVKSLGA
jgi:cytochrome c oxidase subunit II